MNIKKLINNNKWDKIYDSVNKNKIDGYQELVHGNTIAHLAAIHNNDKVIHYYLNKDINVLQKSNDDGNTPIHLLATYGYVDLLKECIRKQPDFLNLSNNDEETVSDILYNDLDFIKWITKFKLPMNGDNLLIKNIEESNRVNDTGYNIIKLLLKNNNKIINDYENSLLCYSIKIGKKHIAELLVKNNYDVNKKDNKYITPFIYAVKMKNDKLVDFLLKKNCDVNYTGPDGNSNPMIMAIVDNNIDLINSLLDHKFDINKYNKQIETSLHYALYNKTLPTSLISKFIYFGDMNIKNINRQTPLHLLCKYHNWKNYDEIIKHKKLDIFIEDNINKRPFDYLDGNYIYDFIDVAVSSYARLLEGNINYIEQCRSSGQGNIKRSIACKNELKKYIFKTKRSIPIAEDNILMNKKIKLINGPQVTHSVFNSDSLHNMIYTIILLKKYKNIGIPFQYYSNDKFINDRMIMNNNLFKQPSEFVISDLVTIYTEYFYELSPYLIIWRGINQNYVHKDLGFLLKKCLLSPKIRYIILKLTLVTGPSSTHANIIIYDKNTNMLDRFEPYGIVEYLETDNLNKFTEELGKKYLNSNLKYNSPKDIFKGIGFQAISNDSNSEVKNLGDPSGFCLAFTFHFLEMRVSNPDMQSNILVKYIMDNIINTKNIAPEKLFITFIRNYAAQLNKLKDDFMKLAGVNDMNTYNLVLSQDDHNKVISLLVSEFNKIILERY